MHCHSERSNESKVNNQHATIAYHLGEQNIVI